jgi:glucokinase
VLVSGPPGSGKTTIPIPLASALGLPLLAKDTVKEALIPRRRRPERSRELGRAAFAVLFAVARSQLEFDGRGSFRGR